MTTMNSEQSNVESNQYVQVNYEYAVQMTDISQKNMSVQTASVANTRRFAVSPLSDSGQSDIIATNQAMLDKSTAEMKTFIAEKLDLKMEDIDKLAVEMLN